MGWFLTILFGTILSAPRGIEFAFLGLFTTLGCCISFKHQDGFLKKNLALIVLLALNNFIVFSFQDYPVSAYDFTAEIKFLTAFFIAPLFLHSFLKSHGVFHEKRLLRFYQTLIPFMCVTAAGSTIMGRFRDTVFFGFSINAAYSVAFLSAYLVRQVSLSVLLLAVLTTCFLGSTTAVALMSLVLFFRYKSHKIIGLSVFALLLCGGIYYAYEFRGKDLLNGDLYSLDRVQINIYISEIVSKTFSFLNYIFGWGAGRELPALSAGDLDVISGWFLPTFTTNGIFSASTHNEYMRLFLDYGFLGLFAIMWRLYNLLPGDFCLILALAAATNTTLFSSFNILVLALIIADHHLRTMRTIKA